MFLQWKKKSMFYHGYLKSICWSSFLFNFDGYKHEGDYISFLDHRSSCSQEGFLLTPSARGFSLYGKDWMIAEVVWSLVVELMDSFLYLDIWESRVQARPTSRNHLQSLFPVKYLCKVETTPKVFTNLHPNSSPNGNQMFKHEKLWRIFYIQNNGDTYNLCFHPTYPKI